MNDDSYVLLLNMHKQIFANFFCYRNLFGYLLADQIRGIKELKYFSISERNFNILHSFTLTSSLNAWHVFITLFYGISKFTYKYKQNMSSVLKFWPALSHENTNLLNPSNTRFKNDDTKFQFFSKMFQYLHLYFCIFLRYILYSYRVKKIPTAKWKI